MDQLNDRWLYRANRVNKQLAEICSEFGLSMGFSCRPLIESTDFFDDFNLRPIIGHELLLANIGVAQVEGLISSENDRKRFFEQLNTIDVDGIFVHINPLQEFLQPEGDRFSTSPFGNTTKIYMICPFNIFVKEVGQGFVLRSLEALSMLDIKGVELGAYGGTNGLELLRSDTRQV